MKQLSIFLITIAFAVFSAYCLGEKQSVLKKIELSKSVKTEVIYNKYKDSLLNDHNEWKRKHDKEKAVNDRLNGKLDETTNLFFEACDNKEFKKAKKLLRIQKKYMDSIKMSDRRLFF